MERARKARRGFLGGIMHIGKWNLTTKDFVWAIFSLVLTLCFLIGLFIYDKACASAVLSGASTAVSIVLSVVAILYTMIEGANSSSINQDTINRLANIDSKLKDISEKTITLKEQEKEFKRVLNMAIETLEKSSEKGVVMDDDIKDTMEKMKVYVTESIDD